MREQTLAPAARLSAPSPALWDRSLLHALGRRARPLYRQCFRPSTIRLDGVVLQIDYDAWSPQMISWLLSEQYELTERKTIRKFLEPNDRVLEVGGAIGLISMLAARIVGEDRVFVYEANPEILAAANQNYTLNGLALRGRHAAVVADNFSGDTVDFFVQENFWSSSLLSRGPATNRIEAPAVKLGALLQRHGPTALIMDVEGAELDILAASNLDGLRKLCVEVHTRYLGLERANELLSKLRDRGLLLDLELSREECLCFRRCAG